MRHPFFDNLAHDNWHESASCVGSWWLFDDDRETRQASVQTRRYELMRKICAECLVIEKCLTESFEFRDFDTFRAGLTGEQRRKIARERGITGLWAERQEELRRGRY